MARRKSTKNLKAASSESPTSDENLQNRSSKNYTMDTLVGVALKVGDGSSSNSGANVADYDYSDNARYPRFNSYRLNLSSLITNTSADIASNVAESGVNARLPTSKAVYDYVQNAGGSGYQTSHLSNSISADSTLLPDGNAIYTYINTQGFLDNDALQDALGPIEGITTGLEGGQSSMQAFLRTIANTLNSEDLHLFVHQTLGMTLDDANKYATAYSVYSNGSNFPASINQSNLSVLAQNDATIAENNNALTYPVPFGRKEKNIKFGVYIDLRGLKSSDTYGTKKCKILLLNDPTKAWTLKPFYFKNIVNAVEYSRNFKFLGNAKLYIHVCSDLLYPLTINVEKGTWNSHDCCRIISIEGGTGMLDHPDLHNSTNILTILGSSKIDYKAEFYDNTSNQYGLGDKIDAGYIIRLTTRDRFRRLVIASNALTENFRYMLMRTNCATYVKYLCFEGCNQYNLNSKNNDLRSTSLNKWALYGDDDSSLTCDQCIFYNVPHAIDATNAQIKNCVFYGNNYCVTSQKGTVSLNGTFEAVNVHQPFRSYSNGRLVWGQGNEGFIYIASKEKLVSIAGGSTAQMNISRSDSLYDFSMHTGYLLSVDSSNNISYITEDAWISAMSSDTGGYSHNVLSNFSITSKCLCNRLYRSTFLSSTQDFNDVSYTCCYWATSSDGYFDNTKQPGEVLKNYYINSNSIDSIADTTYKGYFDDGYFYLEGSTNPPRKAIQHYADIAQKFELDTYKQNKLKCGVSIDDLDEKDLAYVPRQWNSSINYIYFQDVPIANVWVGENQISNETSGNHFNFFMSYYSTNTSYNGNISATMNDNSLSFDSLFGAGNLQTKFNFKSVALCMNDDMICGNWYDIGTLSDGGFGHQHYINSQENLYLKQNGSEYIISPVQDSNISTFARSNFLDQGKWYLSSSISAIFDNSNKLLANVKYINDSLTNLPTTTTLYYAGLSTDGISAGVVDKTKIAKWNGWNGEN